MLRWEIPDKSYFIKQLRNVILISFASAISFVEVNGTPSTTHPSPTHTEDTNRSNARIIRIWQCHVEDNTRAKVKCRE